MKNEARRRGGEEERSEHVLLDFSTSRPLDSRARTARLRRAIADLRAAGAEDRHGHAPGSGHSESIDLTPKSAHEAITRQMVTDLAADVAEIKSRVNAVLWLVASAVAVDVVMRLAGVG
jgi:hypothetical protein